MKNINEFIANLYNGMLIKLNYDPDNSDGLIYKIGKISYIFERNTDRYDAVATARWLAIRTKDSIYEPIYNTGYNVADYIYPHQIPRIQILTDKDLPELALLSLAIS